MPTEPPQGMTSRDAAIIPQIIEHDIIATVEDVAVRTRAPHAQVGGSSADNRLRRSHQVNRCHRCCSGGVGRDRFIAIAQRHVSRLQGAAVGFSHGGHAMHGLPVDDACLPVAGQVDPGNTHRRERLELTRID